MGSLGICRIEGCGKIEKAKSLCNAHYKRWKLHGDPLGGRTPDGELHRFIQEVALTFKGRGCLPWPFGTDSHGYGHLKADGRMAKANRYVCKLVNGDPPTPSHEAAHDCGNRICVNPAHILWKTPVENAADRAKHGTQNAGPKLTEEQVKEILLLNGAEAAREIAIEFGVTPATVVNIRKKRTWAQVSM